MRLSGLSPDGNLVEYIELVDHPFFVATQAHPEFRSRPDDPHPLFFGLMGSAAEKRATRPPEAEKTIDLTSENAGQTGPI
jgi:CTP synthase